MTSEEVYQRLPISLQNLACSYYGWRERSIRLGTEFHRYFESLIGSDFASRFEISSYQDEQIASLVEYAYRTVPYYRRVMDESGIKPGDIVSRSDLKKFPVLRKEDVIAHRADLLSTEFNSRQLRTGATSGTTGTALSFWTTKEAVALQWAVWWRHRHRFGVEPFIWHANFTGRPVVPASQHRPPYWRWSLPMKQALISMQQITPDKVAAIANFLEQKKFSFFVGYPSFLHSFFYLLQDHDIKITINPGHIFLGAENIQEYQKTLIKKATGALITDQYGFSEGCGNASRCPAGPYHEDWEFGVLECGDPEPIGDGKVRGSILATGFANRAFPLIRYDVGDLGVWESENFRCNCGRSSAVLARIEGRAEDYVLTPEGSRIMRFDYLFKGASKIKEAQVVQCELGRIVIRLVRREEFSHRDETEIRQKVRDWISPRLVVDFDFVDEIPRAANGKFRPVLSELTANKTSDIAAT